MYASGMRDRTRSSIRATDPVERRGVRPSGETTSMPHPTVGAPVRSISSNCSRALDGFQVSSSSQNPTTGASDRSTPLLRVPGRPGVRWLATARTGREGSADSTSRSGSSLSWTTIVSMTPSWSWSRMARTASRSCSGRLWVEMTTVRSGRDIPVHATGVPAR